MQKLNGEVEPFPIRKKRLNLVRAKRKKDKNKFASRFFGTRLTSSFVTTKASLATKTSSLQQDLIIKKLLQ